MITLIVDYKGTGREVIYCSMYDQAKAKQKKLLETMANNIEYTAIEQVTFEYVYRTDERGVDNEAQ